MFFALTLIDVNARMAAAWRSAFADVADVEVVHGSILQQPADAWVTPTNSRGDMSGGLDAVIKRYFGNGIEARIRREIKGRFGGRLGVGRAVCAPTAGVWAPPGGPQPRFVISAPTMGTASQDVSRTDNAAWAAAAALQAAVIQNRREPGSIRTIALPGLGTSTGRLPPTAAAAQMRAAVDLMREREFDNFEEMEDALAAHLAEWSPAEHAVPAQPPRARRRILGIF